MITIYSTDSEGRLFTDPKQHFFLDSQLLREKAYYLRRQHLLDEIAKRLGYKDSGSMIAFLRCSGVTADVLEAWIDSGNLAQKLLLF